MVERACPVFPWEQYPTGYIITMVTGVGDGSIFIYPVVFFFLYFFHRSTTSFLLSFLFLPSPRSSRSRVSVAGARERDPKSSHGLSTVPLRFHTPWRILTLAICTEITTPRALSLSRFLRFFSPFFLSPFFSHPSPPSSLLLFFSRFSRKR